MLQDWLLQKVRDVPEAGTGLHAWLFSLARQLHAHMDREAIVALLVAATANAGRPVPLREIRDAVNNSHAIAWRPTERKGGTVRKSDRGAASSYNAFENDAPVLDASTVGAPRKPQRDPVACYMRIQESAAAGVGSLYELWEASPVRLDEDQPWTADDWLDWLLPDAEWICLAVDHPATARSRRREKWMFGPADECGLVVPSPMTGPSGRGLDGRVSHRCLNNTGDRRWLVIEFDSWGKEPIPMDAQAALHWHFRAAAIAMDWPRFRLAVHSGGKSVHGWYGPVSSEEAAAELMAYAVTLGADDATWNRCQLVRLPGGVRKVKAVETQMPDGWEQPAELVRQEVIYFEPEITP